MKWARLAGATTLRYNFSSFPPADHWKQVDVWLPDSCYCPGPPSSVGFTPYAIWSSGFQRGISLHSSCQPGPCWQWGSGFAAGPILPGLPSGSTHTVAMHFHGSTVDYYVDGVFQFTETNVNFVGAFNFMFLNYVGTCCNEVAYYTNVKVGTSQGASDLFFDDFSDGTLDRWFPQPYEFGFPVTASVVDSPSNDVIPTVTVSPTRGMPGDTITITGHGFAPSVPTLLYWSGFNGIQPVEEWNVVTDGAGSFTQTITVPLGAGNGSNGNFPIARPLYVADAAMNLGCTSYTICGYTPSDGIRADWDNPDDQNPTNTPDPIVAVAGANSVTRPASGNYVLDYIFHDGAHWVLWQDPSMIDVAGTFPPPANHALNATRISVDGSSIVDYPIDLDYAWSFGGGDVDDPGFAESRVCPCDGVNHGRPVWSEVVYFAGWSKPIYDAHFASDGTNLWVGVVSGHTVPYPWLDNLDAEGINPGMAAQFLPLSVWTAGFTTFPTSTATGRRIYHTETDGPINIYQAYAFPVSDGGERNTGYWTVPYVAMFSFNGSGFDAIGTIDPKYVGGSTTGGSNSRAGLIGVPQIAQGGRRGDLFSRVALAVSPSNPGVCHVVWSEGGAWGREGLDNGCCQIGTWDGGPQNQSYRVTYSTWSPSAKLTDTDIFESHIDRTNWYFLWNNDNYPNEYPTGYTWPRPDQFGGIANFDIRCDNADGDVLLFVAPTSLRSLCSDVGQDRYGQACPDPGGYRFDDNYMIFCDALQVYDITGGSPVLKHTITPDLWPNEAEADTAYPLTNPGNQPADGQPVRASDCLYAGPTPVDPNNGNPVVSLGPISKGFGISAIYEDPLLDHEPVYLLHVPWARRYGDGIYTDRTAYGQYPMRAFYRIPADMSRGFDFLDGDRQYNFTVLGGLPGIGGTVPNTALASGDFFSDEHNIWVPSVRDSGQVNFGAPGWWFDRICQSQWKQLNAAFTPSYFAISGHLIPYSPCHGFHYDPDGDTLSIVGAINPNIVHPGLFSVQQFFICRGCKSCGCGRTVNIAHRI
jgi:hypothetical protein